MFTTARYRYTLGVH